MFDSAVLFFSEAEATRAVQEANRLASIGRLETTTETETYIENLLSNLSANANATTTVSSTGVITTSVTIPRGDLAMLGFFNQLTEVEADNRCEPHDGGLYMIRKSFLSPPEFGRSESGSLTIYGLFFIVAIIIVGGFAADYANAVRMQARLQVAADAAAHAALLEREYKTPDEARVTALAVAQSAIPPGSHGAAIQASDIRFGHWDATRDRFTVDETSRDAVLVDTQRAAARANGLGTFFLTFVGIDQWTVVRQSVFETYIPSCLEEGFVADVGIEIQSDNLFMAPFCLHSNTWMDFSNNNEFQPGTIVSIPEYSNLQASMSSNTGLADARRIADDRKLRIVHRVQEIYDGVQDPASIHYRSYITNSVPIDIDPKDGMTNANWKQGHIHRFTCTKKNESVNFASDITLRRGVIVSNCVMKMSGATLEDVTLVTLSEDAGSINSNSGLTIGKADNCKAGGGAQVVTMGGVSIPTKMSLHNGQIIAVGNVSFTSHADGSWGGSIISGGIIDANSHNTMRTCGGVGMEDNFNAAYFRLAL